MTRTLIAAALAFALLPAPGGVSEDPVIILLKDGTTFSSDILFVRDTVLVVARVEGLSEAEMTSNPSLIIVISFRQIMLVRTAGRRHVVAGIALGALSGLAIRTAIGAASTDDNGSDVGEALVNNTFGRSLNTATGAPIGTR